MMKKTTLSQSPTPNINGGTLMLLILAASIPLSLVLIPMMQIQARVFQLETMEASHQSRSSQQQEQPTIDSNFGGASNINPISGSGSSDNGRYIPKSSAVACPEIGSNIIPRKDKPVNRQWYKSQFGEDKILMRWFGKLCNGTYLEMGALKGTDYSNSHAFHKSPLNWHGVLLEASPRNIEKLRENRPHDTIIHAGVCSTPSELHWVEGRFDATGGFWEFASERQKKNFFRKTGLEGSTLVKCERLSALLDEHVVKAKGYGITNDGTGNLFYDFYSLDIEGAEHTALETIDFNKVSFGVVVVEASTHNVLKDEAVRSLLEANGYRHIRIPEAEGKTHQVDTDWFVNKQFHTIYKDLLYSVG